MKSYSTPLNSNFRAIERSRAQSALVQTWKQRWQSFLDAIAGYAEPHVWQESNQRGEMLWRAYDPVSDRHFAGSEDDMRRWIEERYYA